MAIDVEWKRQVVDQFAEACLVIAAQFQQLRLNRLRLLRQRADHHLRVVAMRDERAQMGRACCLETLPRIGLARDGAVNFLCYATLTLFVYGEQHLVLRLEMVVNRTGEHPDRLRNIAHRGSMIAAFTEQLRRGVEQPRAAIVLPWHAGYSSCGRRHFPVLLEFKTQRAERNEGFIQKSDPLLSTLR